MPESLGRHFGQLLRNRRAKKASQAGRRRIGLRRQLLTLGMVLALVATIAYASMTIHALTPSGDRGSPTALPSPAPAATRSATAGLASPAPQPVVMATKKAAPTATATARGRTKASAKTAPAPKAPAFKTAPVPKVTPVPNAAPVPATPPPFAGLRKQLDGIIASYPQYQLGVAVIDMSDGVLHTYGVQGKFVAASTGKILAAAAYYHYAELGQLSLTAPMGGDTAAYQIHQMIQQSNNQSWALILGAIGYQRIHDYAAALGIPYDRTFNQLSPAETATLLYRLYTGQLISGTHQNELLSYMQYTNYETLIPAAVPPAVIVFHKYGLLNGYLHDASILVQGGQAYVFVVYTLGGSTADIPARTGIIHELTQAVAETLF